MNYNLNYQLVSTQIINLEQSKKFSRLPLSTLHPSIVEEVEKGWREDGLDRPGHHSTVGMRAHSTNAAAIQMIEVWFYNGRNYTMLQFRLQSEQSPEYTQRLESLDEREAKESEIKAVQKEKSAEIKKGDVITWNDLELKRYKDTDVKVKASGVNDHKGFVSSVMNGYYIVVHTHESANYKTFSPINHTKISVSSHLAKKTGETVELIQP